MLLHPGPTSSKAECVLATGTCTREQHIYTYTHTQLDRSTQTDALGPHTNTDNTNGLVLLPSLAEEDLAKRLGGHHDCCLHCLTRKLQRQGKKTFHHSAR